MLMAMMTAFCMSSYLPQGKRPVIACRRRPGAAPSAGFLYHDRIAADPRAMTKTSIASVLSHQVPIGSPVIVNGWVRSRRTSKGGFSFV
jgi:hypothetical protein